MAFWFDKGVDGFRVDMASSLIKNDPDKKEVSKLWKEMRAWKDKYYPETVLISDWANPQQAIPAGFNIDFYIHFGAFKCSWAYSNAPPFNIKRSLYGLTDRRYNRRS